VASKKGAAPGTDDAVSGGRELVAIGKRTASSLPNNSTQLIRYDNACRALREAKSVDEVKDIRDRAMALRLYARQANDKTLESDAAEIRERAERRLGQMMGAQIPGVLRAGRGQYSRDKSGNDPDLPTLADAGINGDLAKKARATAALDDDLFESALAERKRQLHKSLRVMPLLGIAKAIRTKGERQAIQDAATAAMPVAISDRYHLFCGDMATTDKIEPESVDHIITDPPYTRPLLHCWADLARRARDWLKPGGSLIAMSGHCFLPEVFAALASSGLNYHWTLCYLNNTGPRPQIFDRHIMACWKPLLWYTKGSVDLPWSGDLIPSDAPDKNFHRWGQSVTGMTRIVELASLRGQIIFDPFVGGGSTGVAALSAGRRFMGMDIDQKCIDQTAARLADCEEAPKVAA
jgi:16S rRNA G966 N2-methylase RsmD